MQLNKKVLPKLNGGFRVFGWNCNLKCFCHNVFAEYMFLLNMSYGLGALKNLNARPDETSYLALQLEKI